MSKHEKKVPGVFVKHRLVLFQERLPLSLILNGVCLVDQNWITLSGTSGLNGRAKRFIQKVIWHIIENQKSLIAQGESHDRY